MGIDPTRAEVIRLQNEIKNRKATIAEQAKEIGRMGSDLVLFAKRAEHAEAESRGWEERFSEMVATAKDELAKERKRFGFLMASVNSFQDTKGKMQRCMVDYEVKQIFASLERETKERTRGESGGK